MSEEKTIQMVGAFSQARITEIEKEYTVLQDKYRAEEKAKAENDGQLKDFAKTLTELEVSINKYVSVNYAGIRNLDGVRCVLLLASEDGLV